MLVVFLVIFLAALIHQIRTRFTNVAHNDAVIIKLLEYFKCHDFLFGSAFSVFPFSVNPLFECINSNGWG